MDNDVVISIIDHNANVEIAIVSDDAVMYAIDTNPTPELHIVEGN